MELTIDALREQLQSWDGCELAKQANPVLGEGNFNADIMFVGEAPGKREDEQGRPFVGPAGKLLDSLLESIELKREDVYISNIVKYRPPNNRDPLPEEKEACLPWLLLEISIIKPKVIVPLGRHALTQFFSKLSITDSHGKAQVLNDGMTVLPLYHPAAALHNPGLRDTLFEDIKALKPFITPA